MSKTDWPTTPNRFTCWARAGTIAIFNGNVWHSSYNNRSGAKRRTLHCAFIAREHKQQTNQRQYFAHRDGRATIVPGPLRAGCSWGHGDNWALRTLIKQPVHLRRNSDLRLAPRPCHATHRERAFAVGSAWTQSLGPADTPYPTLS